MLDSKFDFIDANDCLTHKESVLVVDFMSYHARIVDDFGQYLKPRPLGLYIPSRLDPVIDLSGKDVDRATGLPIATQEQLDSSDGITSSTGKHYTKQQLNTLRAYSKSKAHVLPAVIALLKDFSDYYIQQPLRYTRNAHYSINTASKYFTHYPSEVLEDEELCDYLQHRLEDLCHTLNTYLDRDYWKTMFTRLTYTTYYVEKGVDYRIYQWYLSQEDDDLY